MKADEFVEAIKIVALRNAVESAIDTLIKPPGRRPSAEILTLSSWFQRLPADDRENVEKVLTIAVRQSVHNFLAVLDGITAIEPIGPKGQLELYYVKDDSRILLNDDNAEELTSLFRDG